MFKSFFAVLIGSMFLIASLSAQTAPATTQTPAASTPASSTAAQPPAGQKITLAMSLTRSFQNIQRNLTEAAEKMPEADYSFRPTPQMRPFSQLVAHIALSQFGGCSRYKGEPNPNQQKKETEVTTKAEAVALLKASTALCSEAIANLTDTSVMDTIKAGPNEVARGSVIAGSNSHANEVYGTMAVYLRLKNIVPPSTEREEQQRKAAEQPKPTTPAK